MVTNYLDPDFPCWIEAAEWLEEHANYRPEELAELSIYDLLRLADEIAEEQAAQDHYAWIVTGKLRIEIISYHDQKSS